VARVSRIVLAALAAGACGTPTAAPARANVVLYVDTDAPVPKLAGQLRIDFFKTDGTWFSSRDVSAAAPSSWPVSFGVYLPDGETTGQVVVRLRGYPFGKVRDYRGYRYQSRPNDTSETTLRPDPAPTSGPSLLDAEGRDITPPTEPEPLLSIDRLVLVPLSAGKVGAVHVTLAGACFGTMADLRDFGALRTCTDTEAQLGDVVPESVDVESTPPGPTAQGAFEQPYAQPCSGAPRPPSPVFDDDVCVVGGAFVLGSNDNSLGDSSDDLPERVALVRSFYMDRYEVTVARMRAVAAAGFRAASVIDNKLPFDPAQGDEATANCTWSTTPMGREAMPVSCIDWPSARAFCKHEGGDLPLEVQWEYATTMSGRTAKTHYAWGDGTEGLPACTDVVYSRGSAVTFTNFCESLAYGPAAVTAADHPGGDRSVGLAIVDLGGNVGEWTLDDFASLQADCWLAAPLEMPGCIGSGNHHATRGGAWDLTPDQLVASARVNASLLSTGVGFRCVRPGDGP
jgi:formylglycine-generating enzyme required for sulfatase activity